MGADQSTSAQLKSQRDEDIPYTSYSISKPIDAGNGIFAFIDLVVIKPLIVHIQLESIWEGSYK